MDNAKNIINKLNLKPLLIEGGYFRETYRSKEKSKNRNFNTAIYYLITKDNYSKPHRIKSDEIFHFYAGDPAELFVISKKGKLTKTILGPDISKGMKPQSVVPKNCWQWLKVKKGGKFSLLGTTVSPGFEYKDFESISKEELIKKFPKLKKVIGRLI